MNVCTWHPTMDWYPKSMCEPTSYPRFTASLIRIKQLVKTYKGTNELTHVSLVLFLGTSTASTKHFKVKANTMQRPNSCDLIPLCLYLLTR